MQTRKPEEVDMQLKTETLLANHHIHTKLHHKHRLNTRLLGLAICVIVVFVIAAVVLLAVYIGRTPSENGPKKDLWLIFSSNSKLFVKERVVVTDSDVYINVFNKFAVVFDFKNDLVFERYIDSSTSTKSACFSRQMNATQSPHRSLEHYRNIGEITLRNTSTPISAENEVWKFTYVPLTKDVWQNSSDAVHRLCNKTNIYTLKRVARTPVKSCMSPDHSWICFESSIYPCVTYCVHEYHCGFKDHVSTRNVHWYCQEGCSEGNSYCSN